MPKKQVRFSEDNLNRLGKKGTSEDDADNAFKKLLDQDDDIDRMLIFDEEPKTEKLKMLKEKWSKKTEITHHGTQNNEQTSRQLERDIKRFKGDEK